MTVMIQFKKIQKSSMRVKSKQQKQSGGKQEQKKLIITKKKQKIPEQLSPQQLQRNKQYRDAQQKKKNQQSQQKNGNKQANHDKSSQNKDEDTNSIISQLQYQNIQIQLQKKLIIKICDGIYIGGQNSIWDIQTMNANYITHLIRIQCHQKYYFAQSDNDQEKKQKYVPQIITHLHVLPFDFNPSNQNNLNSNLSQIFSKVCQFIQHAHEQGQSCIIINSDSFPHQSDNQSVRNVFQCVYRPAVIAIGYLMCRYSWGMLKAVQFANSRLTAGQKTNQTLQYMNNTKINGTSIYQQNQKKYNNNNLSTIYSQLLTHIIPEVSYQNIFWNLNALPDIANLPIAVLNLLEIQLTKNKSKLLTYGWNKNQQKYMTEEQLVITNTYLNSLMMSSQNISTSQQNPRINSTSKQKQRSDSHRGSLNTLNTRTNILSIQNIKYPEQNIDKQLGILKSERSRQLKNKHSISSGIIGLKNQNNYYHQQTKKQHSKEFYHHYQQNRSSNSKKNISYKNKDATKRVSWNQKIIQSVHQQDFGFNFSNGESKRQSRISSFDETIQCAQMDTYKKLIRNKANNSESKANEEYHENQRENNLQNIVEDKQNKKSKNIISNSMRNKIVVNVIGMINNKNKNTQNISNQRSLINKKCSINQSKARLPTYTQILNQQNLLHNKRQQQKSPNHIHNSQIFRCKTISTLQYLDDKQNIVQKKDSNCEGNKRDMLKKYLDVELDIVMSQGNDNNNRNDSSQGKIIKTLPGSKTTDITQHQSDLSEIGRMQTEPNHSEKQNKNKQNILSQNQLIQKCYSPIESISTSKKQVSPKKLVIKNKIVESTMNKLKQYKNSHTIKTHPIEQDPKIQLKQNNK